MLQLNRRGLNQPASERELDGLRLQYGRSHHFILPKLIEPELLETIVQRVERAQFVFHETHGVLSEFRMVDSAPAATLTFLVSNPAFLRIVERITGCPELGQFTGRVYRITSAADHYSEWHNDVIGDRKVAMTLNLTRQVFRGGALQMKKHNSDELSAEVYNTGFGDALLFRVSKQLLHRVQGVEGGVSRTAFAGWFLEGKDWLSPSTGKAERETHKAPSDASR